MQPHVVACGINLPSATAPVATRFDKLAVRYLTTVRVPAFGEWPR